MIIYSWMTCDGKIVSTEKLTDEEFELIGEAVKIYWATICPNVPGLTVVPPMDWTPFANWWGQEFTKRGFNHIDNHILFQILCDLEGRIGIEQGKCSKPENYCPSYYPWWA